MNGLEILIWLCHFTMWEERDGERWNYGSFVERLRLIIQFSDQAEGSRVVELYP